MTRFMHYIQWGLIIAASLLFVAFAIWWKVSIWTECRSADHSFIYCMRMIQR